MIFSESYLHKLTCNQSALDDGTKVHLAGRCSQFTIPHKDWGVFSLSQIMGIKLRR